MTYVTIRSIINTERGKKSIKYSELEKKLKEAGCRMVRSGAGHDIWINPKTGKQFTVGRHKTQDVPTGTLKSIMKSAGLQ